jgi:endonuclease YncB( thermonuclease family)
MTSLIEENEIECFEDDEELSKCTTDTDYFNFKNEVHKAKVVKCYDGDTVHCAFLYNNKYQVFKIRMYGYDTAEMRPSKSMIDRDIEISKAKIAKKRLQELILNKNIYLFCKGRGKYGRILGEIKLSKNDKQTVNDMMVSEGHGKPYFGGKK